MFFKHGARLKKNGIRFCPFILLKVGICYLADLDKSFPTFPISIQTISYGNKWPLWSNDLYSH